MADNYSPIEETLCEELLTIFTSEITRQGRELIECRNSSLTINSSLVWNRSIQGHSYWLHLCHYLKELPTRELPF